MGWYGIGTRIPPVRDWEISGEALDGSSKSCELQDFDGVLAVDYLKIDYLKIQEVMLFE